MHYRPSTSASYHRSSFNRGVSLVLVMLVALSASACVGEFHHENVAGEGAGDSTELEGPGIDDPTQEPSYVDTLPADEPETAFIDRAGEVIDVFYAGTPVTVELIDGEYVYEGDILLPKDLVTIEDVDLVLEPGEEPPEAMQVRLATRTSNYRWPDNTVPYVIDANLSNPERVADAIAHYHEHTNLRFVERTNETSYVHFVPGSGCSSYVGRTGGRQTINLASACSTGNTIHEIGHALGAWHEHSRADRDQHVKINWENVRSGTSHNFKTYEAMGWDGEEVTEALDFESVMMYSSYSFTSNGRPTIVKLDGSTFSVQRSGLSAGDIDGLNTIYPAAEEETTTEETTTEETTTEETTTEETTTEETTTEETTTEETTTEETTTTEPEPTTEPETPEYVNGQYYVINGLRVLRYYDRWFYYSRYGWREVRLHNGYWYWA